MSDRSSSATESSTQQDRRRSRRKTAGRKAIGVVLILSQIAVTLGLAYGAFLALVAANVLGSSLAIPAVVRLVGFVPLVAGLGVVLQTLRIRSPGTMLASTSVTLVKLLTRKPLGDSAGRTEAFRPEGPYRYVRNPWYLAVILVAFGSGLLFSSALVLLWSLVVVLWFWFLLIPLEEKELAALFGETYSRYRERVPKLFPYRRRFFE